MPDRTDPADRHNSTDSHWEFSPGRLRAHRDLHNCTRATLAIKVGLSMDVLTAYEEGTTAPTDKHLATLAAALDVQPHEFAGPPGAHDSWEYWGLICKSMPPMTSEQIAAVATVLRRIDQRHSDHESSSTGRHLRAA